MRWTRYSVVIRLELYVPHYNYQLIFLNKLLYMKKIFYMIFGCLLFFYYDSWNSGCFLSLAAIIPIKIYYNAEADKDKILKENKDKSGIYMWKNMINGKQYIGSSVDLYNRLLFYFSFSAMENHLKNNKSYIYNAILKHGHSNFSLIILDYCSPDKCIEREDFYLFSLPHEYNILNKAGSPLGRTHSDATKKIMSDAKKGEKNPMYGQNHTEETKTIISDANKGKNNPMFGKPRAEGAGSSSQQIEVTDIKNNTTTCYDSIREAARTLNIHRSVINKYFSNNQQKPYKGQYTFTKTK